METMNVKTINLKDVWRIQYNNGHLLEPCRFLELNEWGMGEVDSIVGLWRVKGYKTLIMLNNLALIPKLSNDE